MFLKKYRFEILSSIFYLLSSIVITFPLILNFNSTIYSLPEEYVLKADVPYSTPVRNADAYGYIWELWWKKQAFLQKIPGNFCPLLGISGDEADAGLFHMPLVGGLGKWLTILKNEVFAFNFLILISFPLAGIAMYFLAHYLIKNRYAAALAGFIFAFAPLHRRYAFEWLGMAQWHWLPLYVLALLKLDQTKSLKWGFLTGLLFSIAFVENYYFGYFTIFFTLAFVLFRVFQYYITEKKFYFDRRRLVSCLLSLVTVLILTLPATLPFIRASHQIAVGEQTEIGGFVRDEWQRFALSARPWYYLLPDVNHPVLGGLTTKFYNWISKKPPFFLTQPFYPREHSLYLGWTTLFLVGAAVTAFLGTVPNFVAMTAFRKKKKASTAEGKPDGLLRCPAMSIHDSRFTIYLFLFLAVVMMIFSAPPYATVSLHKIYFPSHYLYKFFPMFRSYARFGVLVLLCFSILAAFGLKFLLEKIRDKGLLFLVSCLLFLFVFFEFLDFPPFHSVSLDPLPVYEYIAEQPGDFAILVYPEDNSNFDLLAQRIHGKRFLNPKGRTPPEIRELYDDISNLTKQPTIEKLRQWGVKYIIVRRDSSLGLEEHYHLVETFDNPRVYLFEVR